MDLKKLFELQQTFNERVGLDDKKFLAAFSDCSPKRLGVISYDDCLREAGEWVDNILKAMSSEIEELRDCTYWKHWCSEAQEGRRYEIKDLESARKEVIDLLFFWISLCQILGMSADMVRSMYEEKLAKNLKRQDDGYSIEQKDLAWELFQEHDYVNPDVTSLEDLPEHDQQYWLDQAQKHVDRAIEGEKITKNGDGYSIEQKDMAWKLFRGENPKDLPEDIAAYYLNWAREAHLCDTCIHTENDCSMAVGKTHSCIRYKEK